MEQKCATCYCNFGLKNISKDTINNFISVGKGSSTSQVYAVPQVNYNDGYMFYYGDVKDYKEVWHSDLCDPKFVTFRELEVLGSAEVVEAAIVVPNEVVDNEENSLIIDMHLPDSNGESIFSYVVR